MLSGALPPDPCHFRTPVCKLRYGRPIKRSSYRRACRASTTLIPPQPSWRHKVGRCRNAIPAATLTPQFSGMLNLSMSFTLKDDERNIAAAYGRLTQPIIAFLKDEFAIDSYASSIAGAFCDGAHNVAIDGRKLAGTAQRWRLMTQTPDRPSVTRVLGHIAVVCSGDLDSALDAVNGFYRAAKMDREVVRDAHISLHELIGREAAQPQPSHSASARTLRARRLSKRQNNFNLDCSATRCRICGSCDARLPG